MGASKGFCVKEIAMIDKDSVATTVVKIVINRRPYEVEGRPLTGREILAVAGFGEGYDLYLLADEADVTGGELILADQVVDIEEGMRFRAIPGDLTFGGL
ncbi:MAG: multiubiquitin domain-containing protein [Candidatus Eisenbacteria bacterium]